MSSPRSRRAHVPAWLFAAALALVPAAHADVVLDANTRASAIASTLKATPVAVRAMAIVQVSVFDAIASIQGRRPLIVTTASPKGASVDAAVAAATRTTLLALVPGQRDTIEADYQRAIGAIAEGPAKREGIAAGEGAARAVLAARASDGFDAPPTYRPRTTPGVYVPTALPLVPQWGRRKPWVMSTGEQFRPAPPPRLDSEVWKRDLAEIVALGRRNSTRRTAEQTAIAWFWQTTSPNVYWPVARSYVTARGGDAMESARLLAEAAVAMDDAMIAVFDAKYAYEFWRPITAIRNGPEGIGDPSWEPLFETPMHPEYPCAHCILSGALGEVIEAELAGRPSPTLRTTSPTGDGAEHAWASPAEFVREVSEARICAGVHYRNSTEVGQSMGRGIGELAAKRFAAAPR